MSIIIEFGLLSYCWIRSSKNLPHTKMNDSKREREASTSGALERYVSTTEGVYSYKRRLRFGNKKHCAASAARALVEMGSLIRIPKAMIQPVPSLFVTLPRFVKLYCSITTTILLSRVVMAPWKQWHGWLVNNATVNAWNWTMVGDTRSPC